MEKLLALFISVGALITLGFLTTLDNKDIKNQSNQHCELVAMWEADKAKGVPEHQRNGRPNYNQTECK